MVTDKRHARKQYKKKLLVEQQRQRVEDVSEDEAVANKDLLKKVETPKEDKKWSDRDSDSENDDDIEEEKLFSDSDDDKDFFENPLAAIKADKERKEALSKKDRRDSDVSDDWSSDEEDRKNKADAAEDAEKQVGKKRKRKNKDQDNVEAFFTNEAIEEVPADDPATLQNQGFDPEDSDEIAELRVLARKMLRKKDRNEMLDGSYNRFTFNDEKSLLPTWF